MVQASRESNASFSDFNLFLFAIAITVQFWLADRAESRHTLQENKAASSAPAVALWEVMMRRVAPQMRTASRNEMKWRTMFDPKKY